MKDKVHHVNLLVCKEGMQNVFSVKTGDPKESGTSDRMDCAKCNFTTVKKNYLVSHMRSKHQDPDTKIKCEECNFTHIYPSKMKVHYNIVHLGIKRQDDKSTCKVDSCENFGKTTREPYKCNQCNYASFRIRELNAHAKVHGGERSYKCNQCDFASYFSSSLAGHLKTHRDEKPNPASANI